jgi:hypothetical protein
MLRSVHLNKKLLKNILLDINVNNRTIHAIEPLFPQTLGKIEKGNDNMEIFYIRCY